ncbi:MAG: SpoIID/LytB domain-containing protein [Tannerellaceae bacterium]|nr:SpoIID/LytB domain-containing protein [Tannerellaceae bacterium]
MTEPIVQVGILTGKEIRFRLNGSWKEAVTGNISQAEQVVSWVNNRILFDGNFYGELMFIPGNDASSFTLHQVTIGVDFHWERQEDQTFRGALRLLGTENGIVVINRIQIEDYLTSVISSEMSATASKEFLKAHAVISRSWLLAQLDKTHRLASGNEQYTPCYSGDQELIRWYDREDHTLFDVCADDHCQRYQGITRTTRPLVKEVIRETAGEIMVYGDRICDTRFSKCCGGVTEEFETCWEPVHHPYLVALQDGVDNEFPDLTQEKEAIRWIHSSPDAFCNTRDKTILSQVLNKYDQETTDFFRWTKQYSQQELAELICRKSELDFGQILELIPVKRGPSGRIEKLTIVGTTFTYTIGKELEIRRILSESHLYSSAFVVEKREIKKGIPQQFILTGAGWGHGVGLCQIGAAVMGSRGYNYREILTHYFRNATIKGNYGNTP